MKLPADEESDTALLALLSPPQRLAIAYAPRIARADWLALLALDRRLAQTVDPRREPLLAQMRLAWWRDMFARPAAGWPGGEPLLAALRGWDKERPALGELVDGWEALVGEAPLETAAFAAQAHGRAAALAALALRVDAGEVRAAAYRWALADMACHIGDETERRRVLELLRAAPATEAKMSRAMRPLPVLRIMSERAALAGRPVGGVGDMIAAIRAGVFGG